MKNNNLIAIIGIVASVVGTLLGASIGAFVTIHQQEKRMEYENRTRFHDMRLEVYSKFIINVSNIAEACQKGISQDTKDINEVNETAARLYIIGSPEVTDDVIEIASLILQIDNKADDCSQLGNDLLAVMKDMVEAMKSEINIYHQSRNKTTQFK